MQFRGVCYLLKSIHISVGLGYPWVQVPVSVRDPLNQCLCLGLNLLNKDLFMLKPGMCAQFSITNVTRYCSLPFCVALLDLQQNADEKASSIKITWCLTELVIYFFYLMLKRSRTFQNEDCKTFYRLASTFFR